MIVNQIARGYYRQRLSLLFARVVVCATALCGSTSRAQTTPPASPTPAPQAQPQAHFSIYLPLLRTNPAAGAPAPTPGQPSSARGFIERDRQTSTPDIEIDAQGSTQLAYSAARPNTQTYDLVYAVCAAPASSCGAAQRWQRVVLPVTYVDQVQLALTRAGHPRIVARAYAADFRTRSFFYGECDGSCLSASAWSFGEVAAAQPDAEAEYYSYLLPKHFFALDSQDRPRFAFANRFGFTSGARHYDQGGYYAQCDADCVNEQSWTVERFTGLQPGDFFDSYDSIVYPALAFTSADTPRIVALLLPAPGGGEADGIYYFGCDGGCESDAGWERSQIAERGNGPHATWDLALDGNDRAHVAFYTDPDVTTTASKRLFYLTCASDCERGGAWDSLDLGLPAGAGDGVDLALDRQGRPRMAFLNAENNLQYAWCNATCTAVPSWRQTTVETGSRLQAEFPVPILPDCAGGFWNTMAAMLTLDATDAPHIAYRGIYQEQCYDTSPYPGEPPLLSFKDIWYAVRQVSFAQP